MKIFIFFLVLITCFAASPPATAKQTQEQSANHPDEESQPSPSPAASPQQPTPASAFQKNSNQPEPAPTPQPVSTPVPNGSTSKPAPSETPFPQPSQPPAPTPVETVPSSVTPVVTYLPLEEDGKEQPLTLLHGPVGQQPELSVQLPASKPSLLKTPQPAILGAIDQNDGPPEKAPLQKAVDSAYRQTIVPPLAFITRTNPADFYASATIPAPAAAVLLSLSAVSTAAGSLLTAWPKLLTFVSSITRPSGQQNLHTPLFE